MQRCFVEDSKPTLPVRLVAIHLELKRDASVKSEVISAGYLADQLKRIYGMLTSNVDDMISYRRIGRVFDLWTIDGRSVPTILMVKPDESRFWTRSIAMRDADEVSGEILQRVHGLSEKRMGKEH